MKEISSHHRYSEIVYNESKHNEVFNLHITKCLNQHFIVKLNVNCQHDINMQLMSESAPVISMGYTTIKLHVVLR